MKSVIIILFILLASYLGSYQIATADICPTKLDRSIEGYWYSTQHPGWSSIETFPQTITINPDHTGAIVFNPMKARLACVYKNSENKWVAIVSMPTNGIRTDTGILNQQSRRVWQWSDEHQDFSCGIPDANHMAQCRFTLEENLASSSRPNTPHDYFKDR